MSCALGIKGGAWWKAPKPPNCAEVASVQQLVDELEACSERLVVVQASGAAGSPVVLDQHACMEPENNARVFQACHLMLRLLRNTRSSSRPCRRPLAPQFYATWCTGCRALAPHLVALARERPAARFLFVDADDNRVVARRLGVQGAPYTMLFAGAEGCVERFNITAARMGTLRWERCAIPRPISP